MLRLVDHVEDLTTSDRTDWKRSSRFLLASMAKASWLGPLPLEEELVRLCSLICSNNFAVYSVKGKCLGIVACVILLSVP